MVHDFPHALEWQPSCCECDVFILNEILTYIDWIHKCEIHKNLDGQNLIDELIRIDTLHNYQHTIPLGVRIDAHRAKLNIRTWAILQNLNSVIVELDKLENFRNQQMQLKQDSKNAGSGVTQEKL